MEGFPTNIRDLEKPLPVCFLTKATKITRGSTIDVSKSFLRFMLNIHFAFFNVEIIRGFILTFVAICSSTSYPCGLTPGRKHLPLEIIKWLVTKFRNQDHKVVFIQFDEYETRSRSSEFMNTGHNMNIIVQTIGVDANSLNGKLKSQKRQ